LVKDIGRRREKRREERRKKEYGRTEVCINTRREYKYVP